MTAQLRALLAYPGTRGLDTDDPRTMEVRRRILRNKPFLRLIYDEWYRGILGRIPPGDGPILEIGSGPGFLRDYLPRLIASDVLWSPASDLALDGRHLPFDPGSLRAIVMTNVFHHIPELGMFLREAGRAVRPGGVICMVEPWLTSWSRVAYALHAERCLPEAPEWDPPQGGPLSRANEALAWIVFARDRRRFETQFPEREIVEIRPEMPFRYLLSGGISLRSLAPAWSFRFWRWVEHLLEPWMDRPAMFATILLWRRRVAPV
jgi:SAM-dependent methyltransferase